MRLEPLLSLLQFSDGLFPAGAYAHSFGLETYTSDGTVTTAADVAQVLRAFVQGLATCDAIFTAQAVRCTIERDLPGCAALDDQLEAIKSVAETRAASRQLGRQTLRIAAELIDHPMIAGFARMAGDGATSAHHAIVFGIVGTSCGWTPAKTIAALLYASTAGFVGAATRLMPLGQTLAQRLIWNAAEAIPAMAREAANRTLADAHVFQPALEIAGMRHVRLEGRLFKS
jgi:urease accessory protein